jgi:AcrR family transcriptional regulator
LEDELKRGYHHGNLRPALLKAAAQMVSEGGPGKVTMRALSDRIGVSRTALYQHFKNKNDLLSAVAVDSYAGLKARLHEIRSDDASDLVSRLHDMSVAYVAFALENPDQYKLMFGDEVLKDGVSPELSAASLSAYDELISLIEICQEEKRIAGEDPLSVANVFWAMCHGLSMLLLSGQIQVSYRIIRIPVMNIQGRAEDLDNIQKFIHYSVQSLLTGIVTG